MEDEDLDRDVGRGGKRTKKEEGKPGIKREHVLSEEDDGLAIGENVWGPGRERDAAASLFSGLYGRAECPCAREIFMVLHSPDGPDLDSPLFSSTITHSFE